MSPFTWFGELSQSQPESDPLSSGIFSGVIVMLWVGRLASGDGVGVTAPSLTGHLL